MDKILLVGATGFTGKQVLKQLIDIDAVEITCLVRSLEKARGLCESKKVAYIVGDLDDPSSLDEAFKGQNTLIFVASMGFGHMPAVINACNKHDIKRGVFISSTAIFTRLPAQSIDGRQAGELVVTSSDLEWTILRPTMIFGRKGDRNMERLVRNLCRFPLFFIPGPGKALQQPIFVDDVAKAVVQAYQSKNTIRKAYNISGKYSLTFNQMIAETIQELHKTIYTINLPLSLVMTLVKIYNKIFKKALLTSEQVLRVNEDKAFDYNEAHRDFGFEPVGFRQGIANLIKELFKKS